MNTQSSKKPFRSSLIDTVKVRVQVVHPPLFELKTEHPDTVRYVGKKYKVRSKFPGVHALIHSELGGNTILIEASIPKFLTGQNLVGRENLKASAIELIDAALERAHITPTPAERGRYRSGTFELLRVDYAAHVDCGTKSVADNVMIRLRKQMASKAIEFSAFSHETVYWGQHSRRRTLKAYLKGRELAKHPLSEQVFRAERLEKIAQSLVRLEFTLRAEELKRLDLRTPDKWSREVARGILNDMLQRILPLSGKVPNIEGIQDLSRSLQDRLELWLRDCPDAFTRYPGSYSESRKKVLEATGIDIQSTLSPEQQMKCFTTVRQAFEHGFGFRSWNRAWGKLKSGSKGDSGI